MVEVHFDSHQTTLRSICESDKLNLNALPVVTVKFKIFLAMANVAHNVPVSQILKSKSELDDEPKKKSREDWRKAKELEEARKAGTAPAAVDEEGKDINPHIPQYIASAPWYYGTNGPTLKHQRPQVDREGSFSHLNEWYKRGVDSVCSISFFFVYNDNV